ncbi:MAG: uroporphyrinogen-III C-methyltransferase [Gammaproteobacteria bacterium]|nr:uroporphyrinogen-III C-methyltransferase [Gammaproteobacteria bacterium]MDH3507234.1 uroporphyrinogen-III C-methyltransferase [Gammaproteobacteria bacterium]
MTTQVPDEEARNVSDETDAPATEAGALDRAEEAAATSAEGSQNPSGERAAAVEPRRRSATPITLLALALAFFAAAAAGALWWQYRQFYVALDEADGQTIVSLRDIRANLRGLEDRLTELGEAGQETTGVIAQVVERINALPAQFSDLEEQIAAAQGISADVRGRWLRVQAEYFLDIANTELTQRGSRSNAIAALELADQRLLETGSPSYASVRERIAGELLALRGIQVPDIEGLSYSLSRLTASVAELPMRVPIAQGDVAPQTDGGAEPGLGRLWQSLKNALSGMIRIERREPTDAYTLSRDEQVLVRRQLELELTLGRLGLVQTMPDLFAGSLASATRLLEEHFDTEQAPVEGALALLEDMIALDIAPSYPDISGSLAQLRNLPDRDG